MAQTRSRLVQPACWLHEPARTGKINTGGLEGIPDGDKQKVDVCLHREGRWQDRVRHRRAQIDPLPNPPPVALVVDESTDALVGEVVHATVGAAVRPDEAVDGVAHGHALGVEVVEGVAEALVADGTPDGPADRAVSQVVRASRAVGQGRGT